jgi:hypothetical protein
MPPIHLTDDELEAVITAARPLDPWRRDAFLQEVASSLASCSEIGPGIVHRIVAQVQRAHFAPPDLSVGAAGRTSKYR